MSSTFTSVYHFLFRRSDNVTEITDDEYNNLCSHFIDKVFIGNKSTPQEMYSFMKFIDKTRPYDFVIDGLNLALGTDLKSHLAQSNMVRVWKI